MPPAGTGAANQYRTDLVELSVVRRFRNLASHPHAIAKGYINRRGIAVENVKAIGRARISVPGRVLDVKTLETARPLKITNHDSFGGDTGSNGDGTGSSAPLNREDEGEGIAALPVHWLHPTQKHHGQRERQERFHY